MDCNWVDLIGFPIGILIGFLVEFVIGFLIWLLIRFPFRTLMGFN